jgi:hypothetical protein
MIVIKSGFSTENIVPFTLFLRRINALIESTVSDRERKVYELGRYAMRMASLREVCGLTFCLHPL